MTNEIQTINEVPAVNNQQASVLSIIDKMANATEIDFSKLEKMLDMQERIMNKQAEMSFNRDFALMRGELPAIAKNTTGHNCKYATLNAINIAIDPFLSKYGFASSFENSQENGNITVTCVILHKEGHSKRVPLTVKSDDSGKKNDIQAIGSALTYAQRYTLGLALNLSLGVDDDGVATSRKTVELQELKPTSKNWQSAVDKTKREKSTGWLAGKVTILPENELLLTEEAGI